MKANEARAPEQKALEAFTAVPAIYFNGFQIGLSNADASLIGLLDNQPVIKLNMSYTIAKTLVVKLGHMMETFEKSVGREIMTTDDAGSGIEGTQKK